MFFHTEHLLRLNIYFNHEIDYDIIFFETLHYCYILIYIFQIIYFSGIPLVPMHIFIVDSLCE